jgi:hypothetical protein
LARKRTPRFLAKLKPKKDVTVYMHVSKKELKKMVNEAVKSEKRRGGRKKKSPTGAKP